MKQKFMLLLIAVIATINSSCESNSITTNKDDSNLTIEALSEWTLTSAIVEGDIVAVDELNASEYLTILEDMSVKVRDSYAVVDIIDDNTIEYISLNNASWTTYGFNSSDTLVLVFCEAENGAALVGNSAYYYIRVGEGENTTPLIGEWKYYCRCTGAEYVYAAEDNKEGYTITFTDDSMMYEYNNGELTASREIDPKGTTLYYEADDSAKSTLTYVRSDNTLVISPFYLNNDYYEFIEVDEATFTLTTE